MKIVGIYSFNNGRKLIGQKYPNLLKEVKTVISNVSALETKTKESKEKTKRGKILFAPRVLNKAFKNEFAKFGWENKRVPCKYPTQYYTKNYNPEELNKGAYREMDFIKKRLGVEVQFGKYSFMVYNVCAKMTIFNKLDFIDYGIEIVPTKKFAQQMSSGVSYFEQFVWDLEHRGVADIDIPVLILGIDE